MYIIKGFFIILGIIFFLLILSGVYIWLADPFNLKPLISSGIKIESVANIISSESIPVDNVDKNPLLSEEQEAALETLGVNPVNLPTAITPELEICFISKLGEVRTSEIMQGDAPNATDLFKVSACLEIK